MKLETTFVHSKARAGRFWLALFALVSSFAGAIAAAGLLTRSPLAGIPALVAVIALLTWSVMTMSSLTRGERGRIGLSEEGVDFGRSQLRREEVVTAAYTPAVGRRPPSVRLTGRNETELAWFAVSGPEEGERALSALGVAPNQSRAQFYALMKPGTTGFWCVMGVIALSVLGCAFGVWLLQAPALVYAALLPVLAASAYFSPAKVHVGSDGLLFQMRVGSRFFPWSDVMAVEPSKKGITVVLESGERYGITTAARGILHEHERIAQATLVARANDALARFKRGAVPDVSARVARLGRTREAWIAELRDREGGFREAPIRTEDLWALVESPAAEVTARAGAAAVLARGASPEDRTRLRIAADTCAEPRLRVVLDKAATGEDVLEALGDVEDEESAARGAS